jgi:predicted transcriptional regulator
MPKARKGVVQIRFEILEYLYYTPEPQPRTHIWRRATTLSYDDFQKHLAYLLEKGLVVEGHDGDCGITPEGRGIYERLRSVLSSIL